MLCLDSGLEFVFLRLHYEIFYSSWSRNNKKRVHSFLRLEQRDLVRGHDDAHVVDDHALALDGDVAFAGWPRVHNTAQA